MFENDYLEGLDYHQRLKLLNDEAFTDTMLTHGQNPAEVLEIGTFGLAQRCSQPIVMDRLNMSTGLIEPINLSCKSSDRNACLSCATHQQKLRSRQILTGIYAADSSALFTLTAPSFGRVHRASYSAKDEFRSKRLPPTQRASFKLTAMRRNGKCPCGIYHDYQDEAVGTPLGDYDYVGEVIWSNNLPNLTKSAIKRIKYLAKAKGIPTSAISIFAVYERQARASLHCHILITVKSHEDEFLSLVSAINSGWVSPTSRLNPELVDYLKSEKAQKRFDASGVKQKTKVSASIPLATWKKSGLIPATQFGSVYDIRILSDMNSDSDVLTNKRKVAEYVAKYLTKNQSFFSPQALSKLTGRIARHHWAFRNTAIALLTDKAVHDARISTAQRELTSLTNSPIDKRSKGARKHLKLAKEKLAKAKRIGISRSMVATLLLANKENGNFTTSHISDVLESEEVFHEPDTSPRGLKIRLNRLANNAGFTGTLTLISNWATNISKMRMAAIEWVRREKDSSNVESYAWAINLQEMKSERIRRRL